MRSTRTPTLQKPRLRVPDAVELLALADAAQGTPWEIPVLLASATAASRTEVLGLRWSGVDLDRRRFRVDETLQRAGGELKFVPPKTEKSRREAPLTDIAVARLRAHRVEQARRRLTLGVACHDLDRVCERGDGATCEPDSFTHGFRRIAKSIGLDSVRLHDCRHGFLTMLAKNDTPAYVTSKIAGHSSVAFTADTYTHADEETIDRAAASLDAAFRAAGK